MGVERARLADQVEAHIGDGQLLLQQRRGADPFRQAVAEHELIVRQPQDVGKERSVNIRGETIRHRRAIPRGLFPSLREQRSNPSFEKSEEHTSELQSLMRISYA